MTPAHRHLERMAASLQAWERALGSAAAGGAVLEVGSLVGSIVPAAATRSIVNTVSGPFGTSLSASEIDEVAARYESAGIARWGVWVHEQDRLTVGALEEAGLVRDSDPVAMALELAELGPIPDAPGVAVRQTTDLELLAAPLSAGYGFPPALLLDGLPGLLGQAEGWLALVDGQPAAGLLIVTCDGDAGVFMVATAPESRGRGVASAVLHQALEAARARGCLTSTLQSSAMGHSVYSRLGYSDLGRYLLLEHRGDHGASGQFSEGSA